MNSFKKNSMKNIYNENIKLLNSKLYVHKFTRWILQFYDAVSSEQWSGQERVEWWREQLQWNRGHHSL